MRSIRRRLGLALLCLCLGAIAVPTGVSVAYWISSASNNPAVGVADSLPAGSTPTSAATTPAPNSSTVRIDFASVTTVTDGVVVPAGEYVITRYPDGGGFGTVVSASCSGTSTITCDVASEPDGSWRYTDTPTYGSNWVGTESGLSPAVLVDTTGPDVSITYPVDGTAYGTTGWGGAITGTASDASTIAADAVAIEDTATSKWWNGSAFSSSSQLFETASGTTSWSYSLSASALTEGDAYSIEAKSTDSLTNSATSSAVAFALLDPPSSVSLSPSTTTAGAVTVTFTPLVGAPGITYDATACTDLAMTLGCVTDISVSAGDDVTGLVAGTNYYVSLVSNAAGYQSDPTSPVGTVMATVQLNSPAITSVTASGGDSLSITFTGSSNAPGGQSYTAVFCTDSAMTSGCQTFTAYTSGTTETLGAGTYWTRITATASSGYLQALSNIFGPTAT